MQKSLNVIPAKAGAQVFQGLLDPGCHRGDGLVEFRKRLPKFVSGGWIAEQHPSNSTGETLYLFLSGKVPFFRPGGVNVRVYLEEREILVCLCAAS